MNAPLELAPLPTVFDTEAFRIQGLETWDDVPKVGRQNLRMLVLTAQDAVMRAVTSGDREALLAMRRGIDHLQRLEAEATEDKPVLPRLRRESFRVGQAVRVYVGELPGVRPEWLQGTVSSIDKSFRSEWKSGQANSGYYWRVTATFDQEVLPGRNQLPFSTSEPRVVLEAEYRYLVQALRDDPDFVRIFSANAWRDWQPLWCQELGLEVDVRAMDLGGWLRQRHQGNVLERDS